MMGTYRVSQVPDASFPACHGLMTPAALKDLTIAQCSGQALQRVTSLCRIGFTIVNTLADCNMLVSRLYQHLGKHGLPCGLQDSLCTLHLSCSQKNYLLLRHRRNTRYGWVVNPYPTRTLTWQDAPSCAWRANVKLRGRAALCRANEISKAFLKDGSVKTARYSPVALK